MAGLLPALVASRRDWRAAAALLVPESALAPLFGLVRLGYAIESVTPKRITLMCPLLPRARRPR